MGNCHSKKTDPCWNPIKQLIFEWIRDEADLVPRGFKGNKMAEPMARTLLNQKPKLLVDFEIFLTNIPRILGKIDEPIEDIWGNYKQHIAVYQKATTGINPRTSPLEGKGKSPKKRIPMECRRSFPYYVVRAIADNVLKGVDPVTELPEGTILQSPRGLLRRVVLRGDHREKFNGHNTTPDNLQVISNIANGFKSDGSPTIEEIRSRFKASGWKMANIPAEEMAILEKWGQITI